MERPWLKLYTRDYLDHKELRRCSLPARGVWADLLCLMAEGSPRGYLTDKVGPLSLEFISQRTYTPNRLMKRAMEELELQQVLSRTSEGVYFSKKMVDDERLRMSRAEGGAKGGNPQLSVNKVNLDLKISETKKVGPIASGSLDSAKTKRTSFGENQDLDFEQRFQHYRSRHPGVQTRVNDCRAAYMSLVVSACDSVQTADSMDSNQDKWLEYWRITKAFPLGLFAFLTGGDCLVEPPELTDEQQEKARWA